MLEEHVLKVELDGDWPQQPEPELTELCCGEIELIEFCRDVVSNERRVVPTLLRLLLFTSGDSSRRPRSTDGDLVNDLEL